MGKTVDMTPKTLFGKWLLDNMLANEWTCTDVAEKLHTSRQNVCFHVTGKTKPRIFCRFA